MAADVALSNDDMRGHVLDCLLNGAQHALVDAEWASQRAFMAGDGAVGMDRRESQVSAHIMPRRGISRV